MRRTRIIAGIGLLLGYLITVGLYWLFSSDSDVEKLAVSVVGLGLIIWNIGKLLSAKHAFLERFIHKK